MPWSIQTQSLHPPCTWCCFPTHGHHSSSGGYSFANGWFYAFPLPLPSALSMLPSVFGVNLWHANIPPFPHWERSSENLSCCSEWPFQLLVTSVGLLESTAGNNAFLTYKLSLNHRADSCHYAVCAPVWFSRAAFGLQHKGYSAVVTRG